MDWLEGAFRFIKASRPEGVLFALLFLSVGRTMVMRKGLSPKFGRSLFLGFAMIVALQVLFVATVYWLQWHSSTCGFACKLYFPPHSNYYFNQVLVRWMSTLAFNACVGLAGGMAFAWFARKTKGTIIDQLDVDLLTVGGMVAGWPNILIFYGVVFALTVLMTVGKAIAVRSTSVRMIITPVLPFSAAIIALFGNDLAKALKLYEIGVTLVS